MANVGYLLKEENEKAKVLSSYNKFVGLTIATGIYTLFVF
jgi:hypothetical protein